MNEDYSTYSTSEIKVVTSFRLFPIHCSKFIFVHSNTWKKRTWNTAPVSMPLLSSVHEWKSKIGIFVFQCKIEDDLEKTLVSFHAL